MIMLNLVPLNYLNLKISLDQKGDINHNYEALDGLNMLNFNLKEPQLMKKILCVKDDLKTI